MTDRLSTCQLFYIYLCRLKMSNWLNLIIISTSYIDINNSNMLWYKCVDTNFYCTAAGYPTH